MIVVQVRWVHVLIWQVVKFGYFEIQIPGCCELVYHIFYCMFLHCGRTQNYFMLVFMLGSRSKMHHSITCHTQKNSTYQYIGYWRLLMDSFKICITISGVPMDMWYCTVHVGFCWGDIGVTKVYVLKGLCSYFNYAQFILQSYNLFVL